ncbi:MAG: isocitrate/isopropylmalate family dehydrogenase [Opitutaceae bacterium]|nr:isocitrate/isopropylmalate family dehydrogenase [Opitutaceae bacterium]
MKTHRIALYPGDGIGVDVTDAAVAVLRALEPSIESSRFELTRFDWGCRYYDQHGVVAPPDFIATLRPFDAIFLGAVGWPQRLPDYITLKPLITIRQTFDQWACVRPARTFPGVPGPLAGAPTVDLVVIRENSEGEYVDNGGRFRIGHPDEFAVQSALHTRRGIERALRFGFELARKRRHRLTLATKSNAQRYAFTLWDEVLDLVRAEYRDVETDKQHIDAIAMNFVRRPGFFDVVVGSNLFGDILTDLSGAITGGLGLNPSANLNPERTAPSLFEPVHGSAPDIAGKGIANPTGAILALAMMLDWLGEPAAARRVERAVEAVLGRGERTPDLGGNLGTVAFTEKIIGAATA